jgi:hypothetical protein
LVVTAVFVPAGASLIELTAMATVSTSVLAPPEPVLPRSLVETVRVALPLKLPGA